jgi:hypothetical protein
MAKVVRDFFLELLWRILSASMQTSLTTVRLAL